MQERGEKAFFSASQPDTESQPLQVLLVEDNPTDVRWLQEMLIAASTSELFQVTHVDRLHEALQRLTAGRFDAVLLDLSLPDSQGLDTFTTLHAQALAMPVVVLTGLDDKALAVGAVKEGAQDYLVKDQVDGDPCWCAPFTMPLNASALRRPFGINGIGSR